MRFAVAKQQGLVETAIDDIADGYGDSTSLSDRQKAALAFTDAFLANDAGSIAHLVGFTDPERFELAVGLGLFHGFSKVLIALGVEPEPGTMATTEIPTPDTDAPIGSLRGGLDAIDATIEDAVGLGDRDALDAARRRVCTLLGASGVSDGPVQLPGVSDLAELFVIDVHAITDAQFASVAESLGPAPMVALLIGLAVADCRARLTRSGAADLAEREPVG